MGDDFGRQKRASSRSRSRSSSGRQRTSRRHSKSRSPIPRRRSPSRSRSPNRRTGTTTQGNRRSTSRSRSPRRGRYASPPSQSYTRGDRSNRSPSPSRLQRRRSRSRSRSGSRERFRGHGAQSRENMGGPGGRGGRGGRGDFGRGGRFNREEVGRGDYRGGRGGRGGRGRGRGDGPRVESTFMNGTHGGNGNGPKKPDVWGATMMAAEEEEKLKKPVIAEEDKEKPNFGLSGSLAAETNTTASGTLLKYNEPPEAKKPVQKWRLYVFKGDKEIDLLHIHRQSAFLFGRDRNVVDVPIDHPSCSKQHAVLQFRQIVDTDTLGQTKRITKPYMIDLGSANGTFVNGTQIPPSQYFELRISDVLKFGASTREFVLLHESADAT